MTITQTQIEAPASFLFSISFTSLLFCFPSNFKSKIRGFFYHNHLISQVYR